jgi:hypothetical protein
MHTLQVVFSPLLTVVIYPMLKVVMCPLLQLFNVHRGVAEA